MKSKDLKSLCETIATTVEATQPKQLAEGYINSLTEKARQVYSSINEEKDEDEDEKEESPAEEKAENKAEMLMKKLAAKALKRAKKKAATNEEVELAEKAAPGYEDWASDPKVKASFKKQYGKDWKQVMYGRSWNMKKMDEETELAEGVKRMRRLRRAHVSGKGSRETADAYDKELSKVSANRLRRGGATKQTVRGFFNDKPITPAANRAYTEFAKRAMAKASARGKKVFESEQLDEISDTLLFRARAKAKGVGKFKVRTNPSFAGSSKDVPLHKKITQELQRRGSVPVSESEQLDEAGYKRLMRLKKAAYEAGQKGSPSHGKKMRAAAEQTAKVAAGMARRGDASPDAVRGGGSRIGPSGKYTQKAGKLANQRDRALARFRSTAKIARYQETGDFGGKLGKEGVAKKREMQKGMAKFRMDARHGDFGHEISPQSKRTSMRARYNYEKKYGRLKGK